VKVGSTVITEQLNGLEGLNYLYSYLLVSLSILMTEFHISQHKAFCIHTQGVVTPISTVLRAVTGDCNPIYGGCRHQSQL